MYLHKDNKDLFRDIIVTVSEQSGLAESIIEKDYYVTMILKELSKKSNNVVFKGGTSLSKAYHIIDRFSEDIDITFDETLNDTKRKKVKYELLQPISELLSLPIQNWDSIESDKDYNHYDFSYHSVNDDDKNGITPYVKLETALMAYAYPTEEKRISNFIYDYLKDDEMEILKKYDLTPFIMKVQKLSRTFIDKLFAVCDYYMINKPIRNSRHLYDIYKLKNLITFDEEFFNLINEVRIDRSKMNKTFSPSAKEKVDVYEIAKQLCEKDFYANDYNNSTTLLINDDITYEMAKNNFLQIMKKLF